MPDNTAVSETSPDASAWLPKNIKLRIISGAVLAVVAMALAYAGPLPFAALILAVALLISWEWSRVVRGERFDLPFFIHATAVTIAIALAAMGYGAIGVAVLATAAIVIVPPTFGRSAGLSALGVFYVGLPAVALLWLRYDTPYGFMAILLIFAIVWCADTAAFAAGRLIGGPKLWPTISPKKTWAGLLGALSASTAVAALFAFFVPGTSELRLALTGFGLGLVAQGGDLAESALKRLFGLKDASNLIPGHGGFMDRMDSIIAVAIVAALLAFVIAPQAPARALLFGF